MGDSGSSRNSWRPHLRPRPDHQQQATSRNASARSSAYYDDSFRPLPAPPQQPPQPPMFGAQQAGQHGHHHHHGLRPVESRFSLNERFATSRPEYVFGDEDTSSIFYDRMTLASEFDMDAASEMFVGDEAGTPEDETMSNEPWEGDHYDTLCLSSHAHLSKEEIRRAYYRLFLLFYPKTYPESLRPIAQKQFRRAQEAFEVLIDPEKQARYDMYLMSEAADEEDEGSEGKRSRNYDAAFREAIHQRLHSEVWTSSDLGVRFAAGRLPEQFSCRDGMALKAMDFTVGNTFAVSLPAVRRSLERGQALLLQKAQRDGKMTISSSGVDFSTPTLTMSGGVYGVVDQAALVLFTSFSGRYQPLSPSILPRGRLMDLMDKKLCPLFAVRLRQEIVNPRTATEPLASAAAPARWLKSIVEVETGLLPEPSLTAHLEHHIQARRLVQPTVLDASVKAATVLGSRVPRVALGVRQRMYGGIGFARLDTGETLFGREHTFRFLRDPSDGSGPMAPVEFAMLVAPNAEIGLSTSQRWPEQSIISRDSAFTSHSEGGMLGLDQELGAKQRGSWTAAVSTTFTSLGWYLRYSKDFTAQSFTTFSSSSSCDQTVAAVSRATARFEMELCASTFRQDAFFAVRNLFPAGRLSHLGIEVGMSVYDLHLSLYWSRLGQRLSVPFLIAPLQTLSPKFIFWAAVLPFSTVGASRLYFSRRRLIKRSTIRSRQAPDLADPVVQDSIARHRRHADHVTALLSIPVEARQKRLAPRGGLEILSAKYGIPQQSDEEDILLTPTTPTPSNPSGNNQFGDADGFDYSVNADDATHHLAGSWTADEDVADVTIALAALADDTDEGRIRVPADVRKGSLAGFWDPAPGREKVLRVRYSWRGKESVVEVKDGEALEIP